jgi:hypothetical protein
MCSFLHQLFIHLLGFYCCFPDSFATYSCAGPPILCCPSSFSKGEPIQADLVSATSEAPEADESQDGDDAEISLEEDSSTTSPPPTHSKEPSLDKKRKHVEELLSSSTSAPKDAAEEPSALTPSEVEIFDALDS